MFKNLFRITLPIKSLIYQLKKKAYEKDDRHKFALVKVSVTIFVFLALHSTGFRISKWSQLFILSFAVHGFNFHLLKQMISNPSPRRTGNLACWASIFFVCSRTLWNRIWLKKCWKGKSEKLRREGKKKLKIDAGKCVKLTKMLAVTGDCCC